MLINHGAKRTGKTVAEIRNDFIESGAYDALYDEETGLWTQGPDYFIDYYEHFGILTAKNDLYSLYMCFVSILVYFLIFLVLPWYVQSVDKTPHRTCPLDMA